MEPPADFVNRDYRHLHQASDLHYFRVQVRESDLVIGVEQTSWRPALQEKCRRELADLRRELEGYISLHSDFKTSFSPIKLLAGAPTIAQTMARAARLAGVGPMAAVAGAVAQALGEFLAPASREVIIENGGDLYLRGERERTIALLAGSSPFSYRMGVRVCPGGGALGVCTSSGTVGPSISLGKADAVMIRARDAALADAVATAAANLVQQEEDLMKAVDFARGVSGVAGVMAIKGDKMAAWGEMEIVQLPR